MTDILSLDDNKDKFWARFIFEHCGLRVLWDDLTKEVLNENLDDIIHDIFEELRYDAGLNLPLFTSLDSIMIGFQVLGVYIIEAGARMPDVVKYSILFSTEWDYDRWRNWDVDEKERKENLRRFRIAILNYKEGNAIPINF
jgi:hypothetical protein